MKFTFSICALLIFLVAFVDVSALTKNPSSKPSRPSRSPSHLPTGYPTSIPSGIPSPVPSSGIASIYSYMTCAIWILDLQFLQASQHRYRRPIQPHIRQVSQPEYLLHYLLEVIRVFITKQKRIHLWLFKLIQDPQQNPPVHQLFGPQKVKSRKLKIMNFKI